MISVLTTTDRVDVYNGSSWSALVAPSNGALTAWTPAITQVGAVTLTVNYGTQLRVGRMIFFQAAITVTGSGTAANDVVISTPVTTAALSTNSIIGMSWLRDVSAPSNVHADLRWASTTTMKMSSGNSVTDSFLGSNGFAAGLAVGDIIAMFGQVEAAADG